MGEWGCGEKLLDGENDQNIMFDLLFQKEDE